MEAPQGQWEEVMSRKPWEMPAPKADDGRQYRTIDRDTIERLLREHAGAPADAYVDFDLGYHGNSLCDATVRWTP